MKLKRFYSMMTQAIQLSEIDNGSSLKWQKANMVYNDDGTLDVEANRQIAIDFYNTYLRNYIKTAKTVESSVETSNRIHVYLNDGSMFTIHNGDCFDIRYYINGDRSSTEGKDIFRFLLCDSKSNPTYHALTPNRAFGSAGYNFSIFATREEALEKCEVNGDDCTVLLEIYDNWEFKDDYPYKL